MKYMCDATKDEMIANFLQAEIGSSRSKGSVISFATKRGIDHSVIEKPDVGDVHENSLREMLLGDCRGWNRNSMLFANFPRRISWQKVRITDADTDNIRFGNYHLWIELAGDSRNPKDLATRLKSGSIETELDAKLDAGIIDDNRRREQQGNIDSINGCNDAIKRGHTPYPTIAVCPENEGTLILLDGCARMSALFATERVVGIEMFVGFAPLSELSKWGYF
jgi:hypothetical protein